MARDYAARNRKPAAGPAGLPGWVWLIAGLSMGLIVAVIVYIGRPAQPMPMAPAAGAAALASKSKKVEIPPAEEPRFDFYTLLEDEQVVVVPGGKPSNKVGALPPAEAAAPSAPKPAAASVTAAAAPAVTPTAPTATPSGTRYLVLAGSFREQSNAEQHRARLAMAGIEARIEAVKVADGGTWHRVRIGPQPDQARAETVIAQLRASGFDGKLLRLP